MPRPFGRPSTPAEIAYHQRRIGAPVSAKARAMYDARIGKTRVKTTLAERFEAHVDRSAGPDQCHAWTGARTPKGYGIMHVAEIRKTRQAHRVAWELANGPIPDGPGYHGTCICHRCDNPSCVNVAHLFAGTVADNIRDMDAKGRRVVGRKLTVADVAEIRASSATTLELVTRYGISDEHVRRIRRGEAWAGVT
jgi:hypothetical protein